MYALTYSFLWAGNRSRPYLFSERHLALAYLVEAVRDYIRELNKLAGEEVFHVISDEDEIDLLYRFKHWFKEYSRDSWGFEFTWDLDQVEIDPIFGAKDVAS